MSDEQFFCEYCYYNSDSRERCTHCGQDIAHLFDNPSQFIPPLWDGVEETRPHKPSPLEQFNTSAYTVELYGADYMASLMREAMGARLH